MTLTEPSAGQAGSVAPKDPGPGLRELRVWPGRQDEQANSQTFRDLGDGREEEETGSLPERQQREPPVDGGGRGSLHGETCIKSRS